MIFLLLLVSCTHATKDGSPRTSVVTAPDEKGVAVSKSKEGPFIVNVEKVRPWSNDLAKYEPAMYPYLARFQRGSKTLFYVAAQHDSSIKSPTFRLIDKTIRRNEIQLGST